ncbi:MAG: acetyl-CoA decarbonylase/synthase complex subunit gamma [Dehalococcoidia bacterium]|nr:acetyl-CoA decarbonylase/synthase complex subunit gamma [Dehalococcoidia bacterium]
MSMTGVQIYKFLPKTNCKKCGFPTCLAFAMKVAQKSIAITDCPDLSEESTLALESAARPPIQIVTVGADEKKIEVGGEVVMFRHEKTFYHPPGLVIRLKDSTPLEENLKQVEAVASYQVERVGMMFTVDGFAIENDSGDAAAFAKLVAAVAEKAPSPLVLMSTKPDAMKTALEKAGPLRPLIYAATTDNWSDMTELAKAHGCPLAVAAGDGLEGLAGLVEQVTGNGVENIVLDPGGRDYLSSLTQLTQIRRLALKENFRPLGFPVIAFPGEGTDSNEEESMLAGQQVAKYAGIIVLNHFSPSTMYPLLTLRLNIYTDPQKPIQMQPGLYPIGNPKEDSPVCVTTNFSLTYFAVAGELEGSAFPSWLMVCDTEGLSVLTAWAAGKFDAERIAKATKEFNIAGSVNHHRVIIPGHLAVLRGELEEELSGWEVLVGPRDAVDLGAFLKKSW